MVKQTRSWSSPVLNADVVRVRRGRMVSALPRGRDMTPFWSVVRVLPHPLPPPPLPPGDVCVSVWSVIVYESSHTFRVVTSGAFSLRPRQTYCWYFHRTLVCDSRGGRSDPNFRRRFMLILMIRTITIFMFVVYKLCKILWLLVSKKKE